MTAVLWAGCGSVHQDPGTSNDGGLGGPGGTIDAPPTCGARGQVCCAGGTCNTGATCDGTACIAADVWASGSDGLANFNGGSWVHPRLSGSTSPVPSVLALWGTSSSFVVGVGAGGLIVRKDEAGWHKDQVPSTDGTGTLYGVGGSSANDVWAVGDGVLQHYDGVSWSKITAPNINYPYSGVWLSGPGEGWATGTEVVLAHLSAGAWTDAGHGGNGYDRVSIWGSSASNIWKVGDRHTLMGQFAAIDHYDGVSWTAATLSGGDLPPLNAVWGSDANHVWAVGNGGTMLFFDGALWKPILPGTTENLTAIWGSGPNDVWVAGASSIRHFNGTAWNAVTAAGTPSAPVAIWLSAD